MTGDKPNNLLRKPRRPQVKIIEFPYSKLSIVSPKNTLNPIYQTQSDSDSSSSNDDFEESTLFDPLNKNTPALPSATPQNIQFGALKTKSGKQISFHLDEKNEDEKDDDDLTLSIGNGSESDEEKMNPIQYDLLLSSVANSVRPELRSSVKFRKIIREYSMFRQTNTQMRPYKTPGPDPLPARVPKKLQKKKEFYDSIGYGDDLMIRRESLPTFTFNDFLMDKLSRETQISKCELKEKILSKQTYTKFCKMLEERIYKERKNKGKLHVQTLVPDIEPFENRIPLRQIIIEMANFLKKELSESMGVNLKAKFNPLPKWQKMQGSHTEIVVYEDDNPKKDPEIPAEDNGEITPAQLAVVDSLLRNGLALSLKAHFIDQLPDISALTSTLIYLNLSFNNFTSVPKIIYNMVQLEALKLRNNPIKSLDLQMSQLKSIKILTLSYCLLETDIPTCVYMMENLRYLDVSYNRIKYISKLIVNLNNLKYLNVEGNEIEYLPSSMLTMHHLQTINVKNNYLHPVLWKNAMINQAQTLFDLSIYALNENYERYKLGKKKITSDIVYIMQNQEICDCCNGPRYGEGLKLIRPCLKIFGVKYLPFMFQCCSPRCLNRYKRQKSFYEETDD